MEFATWDDMVITKVNRIRIYSPNDLDTGPATRIHNKILWDSAGHVTFNPPTIHPLYLVEIDGYRFWQCEACSYVEPEEVE